MHALQLGLFGGGGPSVDASFSRLRHRTLEHGAWFDWAPDWLAGSHEVFESLRARTRWRNERTQMYDRVVDVPRQMAMIPEDGPGHPAFALVQRALQTRYGTYLDRVSLGLYRNAQDSVALHGDRGMRDLDQDTLMAIVSVGDRRRFLLKPRAGGRSISLQLGGGDLLVMGGSIQRTYLHGVPKVARAGPRIACMFRSSNLSY